LRLRRRRRPQSSQLEPHVESRHRGIGDAGSVLPGGLSIEQGLAESNVRPGPDTLCQVYAARTHRVRTVEHRFMPDATICICGEVRTVADGWRGRPIVIVEDLHPR